MSLPHNSNPARDTVRRISVYILQLLVRVWAGVGVTLRR